VNGLIHQWLLHGVMVGDKRHAHQILKERGFDMVRHSTHTASLFSVLMAALMGSLFLVGGANADGLYFYIVNK
jgi:hypothetical protein